MKNKSVRIALTVIAALLIVAVAYYVTLPPISIYSGEFWSFMLFVDAVILAAYFIIGIIRGKIFRESVNISSGHVDLGAILRGRKKFGFLKLQIIVTVAAVLFVLVGSIASSTMFNAKTYSSLIDVRDAEFSDIPETEYVSDIALMDTASARIIGARTLGTLADLVSQFNISDSYTQIAMQGSDGSAHPYKVAPLEYASFFKWLQNGKNGIPGYVKVDAVEFEADFVRLTGDFIKYSPSSYFGTDLMRALRFKYPTAIFGSICFEVDDTGHPYWVASAMKPNAGLFGAMDVDYVVTLDACTGESKKYTPAESPEWIDIVYYGSLVCQKYDWYGMLREGYLNSEFSQTNCVVTTDDFGYKIIGNDVYIFTGVTSTSNDEANIGFILANSRTGEYSFYSVPGAEEYSAMAAAEGSVQQYRYTASFPSLVNVDGEATYIMVLKDASGIVKMYSMVNVENYNIVVTSNTQADVFQKYKAALAGSGKRPEADVLESEVVTVYEIIYVAQNGNTTVYLKTSGGVFGMPFDESVLLIDEGAAATVYYSSKNEEGVTQILKIEK
ncbi:MAG: hypothetical protein IJC62_01930 [Clostridia bacterium]|nr:hypothetical protein [Clostridia bacterium]